MNMKFYQIQFFRNGCGTFVYFESESETAREKACEIANEFLVKERDKYRPWGSQFLPVRSPRVIEYDKNKHCKKRKGETFRLSLSFIEFTFASGRKERNEWYKTNPSL